MGPQLTIPKRYIMGSYRNRYLLSINSGGQKLIYMHMLTCLSFDVYVRVNACLCVYACVYAREFNLDTNTKASDNTSKICYVQL